MVIGSNQRMYALSNNRINIEIDGKAIQTVDAAKSLGLLIKRGFFMVKTYGR